MSKNDKFEIFTVTYLLPKFGTDGNEFNEHEYHMMVSTKGGKEDAQAACEKYHSGCKVINVVTQFEEMCVVKNITCKKRKSK